MRRAAWAKFETRLRKRWGLWGWGYQASKRLRVTSGTRESLWHVWEDQGTNLPLPCRMPTFLRSMPFVLALTAASWPPAGLIASSTSGMLWEVRCPPCRPAQCFLCRLTQLAPEWAMALDFFVLPHVEHSCGQSLGTHGTPGQCAEEGERFPDSGFQACKMGRTELRWSLLGEVRVLYWGQAFEEQVRGPITSPH